MQIDESSGHARVYQWTRRAWAYAWGNGGRWDCDESRRQDVGCPIKTDLCTYARTLFLWFPLIVLVYLGVGGGLIYAFVILPVLLFGGGYGMFWLYACGLVAAVALLCWSEKHFSVVSGFFRIVGKIIGGFWNLSVKKTGVAGVTVIAYEAIKDQHNRICRFIEIGGEKKEA
jgi:hypothetical protein